jgi:ABC-2 type transport system permease protein
MELLLSQPVPRSRLILAHFAVDLIVLPVLASAAVAGTHAGLYLVGPFRVDHTALDKLPKPAAAFLGPDRGPDVLPVDAGGLPAAAVQLAALMFAVSGLTMAVSAAGRSRWRTTGLAVLVVLGMFVANVVGQLWDAVAGVRPLTAFFYYQPQKVWLKGDWLADPGEAWGADGWRVPAAGVLAAVGLVGYAVAARVFARRDVPAPL